MKLLFKKIKFAATAWTVICLMIGFWGTMVLIRSLAPQMRAASIMNENLTKIHSEELSKNINQKQIYTNYNGINFLINKIDNNALTITINTNKMTIPSDKIKPEIVNRQKALGYITCDGLTKDEFNNKDLLLKEQFNNLNPIRFANNYPQSGDKANGYFFSMTQKGKNIFYNDSNQVGVFIANPNIYAIRISIVYDMSLTNTNLAQQTYNYLILK